MKVLFISGMYPLPNNKAAGIFIMHRLRELVKEEVDFYTIAPVVSESRTLFAVRRLIGRKLDNTFESIDWLGQDDVGFNVFKVKQTVFKKAIDFFFNDTAFVEAATDLLESAFEATSFDMIVCHWLYPHGYVAKKLAARLKVPYVVTAHGSDVNVLPRKSKAIARRIVQVLQAADKSIFVSNRLLENAKKLGYKGDNAVVIPNGIKSEYFNISMDRESRLLARGETRTVGFVGNLIDIKRADKLPRIFWEIRKMRQDTEFIVVGDGELRHTICKQCEDYQLPANFVGRVLPDQVPNYMNLMDVLVLPSRNEGWPCVVLEAQACGVPVVGSDNGGIPEAIGEGGSVVPDGENFEERFAKAVVEILKNPIDPQELRKRAVQFDWSITVGKEIEVYRDVLSNRKSAK